MTCPQCDKVFYRSASLIRTATPCCSRACLAARQGSDIDPIVAFWKKVDKNGPNGCWVWTGYCQRRGHGWLGRQVKGVNYGYLAHRFAWGLLRGPLKDDDCLLHKCNNPPCVNPDHLYIGDRKDNARDMIAAGRAKFYERAVLTPEQVIEIRKAYWHTKGGRRGGRSNSSELAEKYGISRGAIQALVSGRTWRNVADENPSSGDNHDG